MFVKRQEKTLNDSKQRFPIYFISFFAPWMFTTAVKFVQVARRGRFENSVCFPTRKILPKNRSLFMTNESKASFCRNSTFLVNRTKITTGLTTPYLEQTDEPPCQYFMRRTTQKNLFHSLTTENDKAPFFFLFFVFKLLAVPFKQGHPARM